MAGTVEPAPDSPADSSRHVPKWRPVSALQQKPKSGTTAAYEAAENSVPGSDRGHATQPLPIAATLFRALDTAGARYGVIQDTSTLPQALAGRDDIDLLLEKQDYGLFCTIVGKLHGLRGTSLSCYDNVCAGREDWFLPDFAHGSYLHLDVHIGVRVGWEFRKRYLMYDHISFSRWNRTMIGGVSIPIALPEDEFRLALSRVAFGSWAAPWRRWVGGLRGNWDAVLTRQPLPIDNEGQHAVAFNSGRGQRVSCRIHRYGDGVLVHRGDLRKLRRSIRGECGFRGTGITDFAVHLVRKTSYFTLRLLERIAPTRIPPKRRPANGGIVVAIVGPDGVGKSTQVDRLVRVFGWKFGCVKAYAGTGDGRGWWLRKLIAKRLIPHRTRIRAVIHRDGEPSRARNRLSKLYAAGLGCWGLLIALERYAMVRRAHRSAARGRIVICDRWPQALQPGYLDGPIIPRGPDRLPGLKALASLEKKLYEKMQMMRPHLTLHLISDHAISERRKPGEITKAAFDARLALMAELRRIDKEIKTVDACGTMQAVGSVMFRHVWQSL